QRRLLARPLGIRREVELAALYATTGREDEAMSRLQWIQAHEADATAAILARAISVAGELKAAGPERDLLTIDLVQRTVGRFPGSSLQVYGGALRAMARLGRLDQEFDTLALQAAVASEDADDLTIGGAVPWRDLAQALVDEGEHAAAGRILRTRIQAHSDLEPPTVSVLARMALAADAAAGEPVATIGLLRELHRRSALRGVVSTDGAPTLADAFYEASSVYSILGQHEGSDVLLVETLRLDPDRAMAMNNIGYTRIEIGRHDPETVAWIEQAYALQPDDVNILDTIGWLRYRQGRFRGEGDDDGALELIEQAIAASDEPSAEVLEHLGDTLWRLGERDRAVDAWTRAARELDDSSLRELILQNLRLIQVREWRLLVADPDTLYHQQFGATLERVQEKLRRVEAGREPTLAATFAELNQPDPPGDP
ncbi:MAG: tetratricopeptide repeat protein, partial [Planctomycetota bacterium]